MVVMVGFVLRAGGVPSIIWGASGGHLTRKTKEHHKEERESCKFLLLLRWEGDSSCISTLGQRRL